MTPGSLLVVEPYLGGSHRSWAEGLQRHLGAEIISLPDRFWKWRMRGAAVTLAEQCADLARPPDVVLASDMMDLAAFRTFSRSHLGDVPVALYFHESQFSYPVSPRSRSDDTYPFINWLSALAADRVFFNSAYHRDVFFQEVPRLLDRFPDAGHRHLVAGVEERSDVLEVGVELGWVPEELPVRFGPLRIVWNHRWEHDKDPEAFFAAVDQLAAEGADFELVVCGESFGNEPSLFKGAARRHHDRIVDFGHLPLDRYRQALLDSDLVVSTARQEFFGIAVVEAMAAGCFPVLPHRLSYPGLVADRWHGTVLYPDGALADRLRWAIDHPGEVRSTARQIAGEMHRYGWTEMAPRYRKALQAL